MEVFIILLWIVKLSFSEDLVKIDIPPRDTSRYETVALKINEEFVLDEYLLCLQFRLQNSVARVNIFEDSENKHDLDLQFQQEIGIMTISDIEYVFNIPKRGLKLFSWMHFCFNINDTVYKVVVDDEKWFEEFHGLQNGEYKNLKLGNIKFGKDTPVGLQISNFYIWPKAYSQEAVIEYTSACALSNVSAGVIDWRNLTQESFQYSESPQVIQMVERNELCRDKIESKIVLFKKTLEFYQAKYFCEVMGGELEYPLNLTKNEAISIGDICNEHLWTPLLKMKQQKGEQPKFKNAVTEVKVNTSELPWRKNEPNGKNLEQCAVLDLNPDPLRLNKYVDVSCTKTKACFYCRFDRIKVFSLKGLERNSPIDYSYTLDLASENFFNDIPIFKGAFSTSIVYDQTRQYWSIVSNKNGVPRQDFELVYNGSNSNVLAFYQNDPQTFVSPSGTYLWNFTKPTMPQRRLKLSKVNT